MLKATIASSPGSLMSKPDFFASAFEQNSPTIMFLKLNPYNQVPLFSESPSFKGFCLWATACLQFSFESAHVFARHLTSVEPCVCTCGRGSLRIYTLTASLFALQVEVEEVCGNRRGTARANSVVTFCCDEKIHVYSTLVQTNVNINLSVWESILKMDSFGIGGISLYSPTD